jgi:hypothetical protein
MFSNLFSGLLGKAKSAKSKVTISSVNLKFMGNSHSLGGMEVNSGIFDYTIPFQNKMGSSLLPDNLKGPSMRISSITVSAPFKLIEVNPKLPVDVPYMSKTSFTLKIQAPSVTYEGPISINFGNDSSENIAISVQKVILMHSGKSVDLENSEMVATMQKSQLFKKEIQLYKIISFNDHVNSIEVGKPFELVSVSPNLPITADKKDSYIISLYIKAPQFSYSGNMEIKIS